MSYQNVKNSRQRLKERLVYVMGGQCCICGYKRSITALEFHHINPEEKDFSISTNANIAFAKASEEVKKCILVCANCHREIHDDIIPCPQNTTYDEEKNEIIKQELLDLKTRKNTYCQNCGKIITQGSQFCPECYYKTKRVIERPMRQELKKLIRTVPFVQLAQQFNVSDNAIRKWCDAYNLPRKKTDIVKYTDEEWENI